MRSGSAQFTDFHAGADIVRLLAHTVRSTELL